MQSCLYEGAVAHCRRSPVKHAFRSRLWMAMLDLQELSSVVGPRRLISHRKWAGCSFLASDHLHGAGNLLADEVRAVARRAIPHCPSGPVRLLTQLRCLGHYFSPLNLFYLYDSPAEEVACIVAEVNNTPWGERRLYVLDATQMQGGRVMHFEHAKAMHVSPFMPMDLRYHWRVTPPGDRLSIGLACRREGAPLFHAALTMQRRELTRGNLHRAVLRQPAIGLQTLSAIYYQALRLWWKQCPFFPHPNSPSRPLPPQTRGTPAP